MQWFRALLPREEAFFDRFVEHARLLLEGAEALRALLDGGDRVPEWCETIVRHEHAADAITRDVLLAIAGPSSPRSIEAISAT
jgi:uncharacterized protein Yka (UPF0111/DUF47 family)